MTSEDIQKLREEISKDFEIKNTQKPCPSCGYCPSCGRQEYNRYVYWPYGYTQPYITSTYA